MKTFFIYLILASIFLIIKTTILHILLPSVLIPDVILIMVFYLGFRRNSIEGVITVFALGYLSDVFSGGIIGVSSFTLVFIFVATSIFAKALILNNVVTKIGGVFVMSILKGILTYIALKFLNEKIPFYIILPTAVSTGIISLFIIFLLERVETSLIKR